MTTYVFPGQGSQFKGMGDGLFDRFPELTEKADSILGYSIKTLCLEDPHQHLTKTLYTQPALYTINALTYFKKSQDEVKAPNFVAGHSLGEYNALLAANVFDFETGLKLVKKRGELMDQASGGAMAAVLGLKAETIYSLLKTHHSINVTVANDNSYTQIVISGLKEDVIQAQELCEQAGAALVVPLNVAGAFHSPFMCPAQGQFETFLRDFQFNPPSLPIIANYTAKPYEATETANNPSR